MLATLVDDPFSDPDWLFETKWDGMRAVCFLDHGKARFVSRNQNELTAQYPELANIADGIDGSRAILDGEIVALDEQGVSRFQLLQSRMGRKNKAEIGRLAARTRLVYYVFDLLYLDGVDLTGCALVERKARLEAILKSAKNVRYSDHIIEHGEELYKEIAKVPLEGMVAKRLDSVYVQKRSRDWLKIKTIAGIRSRDRRLHRSLAIRAATSARWSLGCTTAASCITSRTSAAALTKRVWNRFTNCCSR